MRRALWLAMILAIVAAACADDDGPESASDGSASTDGSDVNADVVTFCNAWPALAGELAFDVAADAGQDLERRLEDRRELLDDVTAVVPDEIQADLAIIATHEALVADVLFTAGLDPGAVTEQMLTQAFGSPEEAEASVQRAADAATAIDEWTLTGCGDFCDRWPQLSRIFDALRGDYNRVLDAYASAMTETTSAPSLASAGLRAQLRVLEVASALVPDSLRDDWGVAVEIRADWIELGEQFDFRVWDQDEREVRAAAADVIADSTWAAVAEADVGEAAPILLDPYSPEVRDFVDSFTDPIVDWSDANCERTGGLPGTVSVAFDDISAFAQTRGELMVVVLEVDTAFDELVDGTEILAGQCHELGNFATMTPTQFAQIPEIADEFSSPLAYNDPANRGAGLCFFPGEPAVLDGGRYQLFVGMFESNPGHLDGYVLPPTTCGITEIVVDGDVVVDAPPLGPCPFGSPTSDPDEDAWRYPVPVDPDTPGAGTISLRLESMISPWDADHVEMQVVALPEGTTLNDVGRAEVWPPGASLVAPVPRHFYERELEQQREPGGREDFLEMVEAAWTDVVVPLEALPPSGRPQGLASFDTLRNAWWNGTSLPWDPVLFPPGDYTVRFAVFYASEGADEVQLCLAVDVTVDGDVEIPLSFDDLGDCP